MIPIGEVKDVDIKLATNLVIITEFQNMWMQ